MNKAELKAINIIATKMNWMHKPVCETIETIKQMVSNQQALMMDTIGECDDFEDELLTLAIQDADKIISRLYVSDYFSLAEWCNFLETMHLDGMTAHALLSTYDLVQAAIAEDYDEEYEAYLEDYYSDYDAEILRDVMWMNHHC